MIATDDKNIGTSGDEFNDSTAKYVLGNAWNGNSYRYTLSKEMHRKEKPGMPGHILFILMQKEM